MTAPAPELRVDVRLPLDRFDLVVELQAQRPVTGIFGASGSGKTSLLETIAGLRRGARGRIRLGDHVWLDSDAGVFVPPERRDVGYVPQDGLLFPHWNVRQNLLAGRRRAERRGQAPEATLESVVHLLELTPLLDRAVATLSGGERQRVALGRALCSGPRLLLLDEPLASLDLPLRRKLLPFLRRIRSEFHIPMLLVSHDPIEVQALCDEILVLRQGQPIARGEPRSVLTDPAVFPLAEEEGFENILPGTLVRHAASTSLVRLANGLELVTRRADAAPESTVLVGLPAADILLATVRPVGLSARNVLAGRITAIRAQADFALVTASLAPELPPLTIEVTEATPSELGLQTGGEVYVVVKAMACRVYATGPGNCS